MPSSFATPLSVRLRSATRLLHAQVERAGIMQDLLRGTLEVPIYVDLLRNLHAIYAALEPALLRMAHDPRVASMGLTEVFRLSALTSDLNALSAPNDWRALPLQGATEAYVSRLQWASDVEPVRLVAHAYVRYLGDLNGGQMLARVVARIAAHLDQPCVAFYDFGGAAVAASRARLFRQALDALPLTGVEMTTLEAEATWAFRQHELIFESLDTRPRSPSQALSA